MSKILTIKALVYKYTGWYLAQAEQEAYEESDEHKKYVQDILAGNDPNDDWPIDEEEAEGISIGMWQAQWGFARPATFLCYNKPQWAWRFIAWWVDLYTVLKWDIKTLWRKL